LVYCNFWFSYNLKTIQVLVHIFIPFLFLINQGILTGIAVIMQIHALYQMLDQALPHIVANAMATAAAPKPPPSLGLG
jgi:hypothetical protein